MTESDGRVIQLSQYTDAGSESVGRVTRTNADNELTQKNSPSDETSSNATPAGGLQTFATLTGKTWVYHCMCSHGAVVYVGVANNVGRRLRQHKADKDWWPSVDLVIANRYATREQALEVEKHSIRTGNFTHMRNRQHATESPLDPYEWEVSRDWNTKPEIAMNAYFTLPYRLGSRTVFSLDPDFAEMCERYGLSSSVGAV